MSRDRRSPPRYDLERLQALLPAIYRLRDVPLGKPLEQVLDVLADQVAVLEEDLDQLYDDQFVETCAEWVLPYLGDLLGVRPLNPVSELGAYSPRAYVANTLAYRRRKGTAAVLEQLALDVTGWRARAVESFELLAVTQHLDHVRRDRGTTLDLGDADALDLLDGPFDRAAHTADVRRIATRRGRHNIPNVGLFLWRLATYGLSKAPAPGAGTAGCYRFSALGHDMPLFHPAETETKITHLAEEVNVPGPIRPFAFYLDLEGQRQGTTAGSRYYGEDRGLAVYRDGALVPATDVVCRNLGDWTRRPPAGTVAIDVERGRLAFAAGELPSQVEVSYGYGFSADLGGGPYDRQGTLTDPGKVQKVIDVKKQTATDTFQKALQQWWDAGRVPCLIRVLDNQVYGGRLRIELPEKGRLVIEAADGRRPNVQPVGVVEVAGPRDSSLTLAGLLLEEAIKIEGDVELSLVHCTLVPGRGLRDDGTATNPSSPSLLVTPDNAQARVTLAFCITGPLWLPPESYLGVDDSIVDSPGDKPAVAAGDGGTGPRLAVRRSTFLGPVRVRELSASDALFTDPVEVERRQEGCVRFSYLPAPSLTPRRVRCQPDEALAAAARRAGKKGVDPGERARVLSRLRPGFTSRHYGEPGYAQLLSTTAEEIRAGAEDGSEMGVFHHLKQPQREKNLRTALEEYLRFGFEAGIFYAT